VFFSPLKGFLEFSALAIVFQVIFMLLSIRFVIPAAIIIYEDRILPQFNYCIGQPPTVHEDFDEDMIN